MAATGMQETMVYGHTHTPPETESYLYPELMRLISRANPTDGRIFEIGAGAGWTAQRLSEEGFAVTGVEPSSDGTALARKNAPRAEIYQGSGYDELAARFGKFRIVFALEVIEHVYDPRRFVKTAYDLLEPGGSLILSTPFHGYWKNLAMAISGRLDAHFTALWDHGHIKFWSRKTIKELLLESGFENVRFSYAGRLYPFSKSFFICAER